MEAGRNVSDMDLAFTAIIGCDDTCCKDQKALYGTAERVSRSTMWRYKWLIPPISPSFPSRPLFAYTVSSWQCNRNTVKQVLRHVITMKFGAGSLARFRLPRPGMNANG